MREPTYQADMQAGDDLAGSVAVAPRVTLADLEARIIYEFHFTAGAALKALQGEDGGELDLLSICVLTMRNGFTIIGKSAPASPANFDAAVGRTFAREDALRQAWPLEGYALRDRLHAEAGA